ncbi:hypothetical protein NC652_038648 [Populus alba x Populus x berolinensis]|uniref:Uncharacterized protein n=1 Tax=Populus alba TaxID=43335 RepID=A0A4U5PTY0_POPAL|nr:hypothetical protein NC652_038648 [Populus alba x Populus x berolinensis]TKS00883.1 hypothetical protein D5086_0000178680 [Populus alba]
MEVLLNAKAASSIPEYDDSNYNRAKEFKAFEETKAGVKGLVDSGVTKIPGFFVYAPENVEKSTAKAKTNTITNDKFGSVEHRVLVGDVRSRTSVACFFHPSAANQFKPYGVIKELLSDGSLKYRGTHIAEFMACISLLPSPCPRSPAIVVNMEVSDNAESSINEEESNYDRGKEVKAFEETKACVKGLVDSGASNIPRILSTHQRKCDSRLQMLVISAFRSQK